MTFEQASRSWLFALLVFVALSGLSPLSVRAEAPGSAEAAQSAEYKALIEQALDEFRHKNWPEARVLFRRAHELSPNARTLRGMGIVSYEMRDYVQAARQLDAALRDTRQPLTEGQRKESESLLARARTFIGTYTLVLTPVDAELKVDGRRAEREGDGSLLLAFGEHVLTASAPGYEDQSARVTVRGAERETLHLTLTPASTAALQPAVTEPTEGEPEVLPSFEEQKPEPAAAKRDSGLRGGGLRYTWVALSVSAVFGGAAGAFWLLGDKKLDDLDSRCARRAEAGNPCEHGNTNTDAVKRYERLTNASLGVSAGALVAAGVLAFFEWPRERDLSVGATASSVFVRGAF